MASEKPIIDFDLHETRESTGERAVFVEPVNIHKFAGEVYKLASDLERKENLGRSGNKRIAHCLELEQFIKDPNGSICEAFGSMIQIQKEKAQ
jgi:hypothetical protein